MKNVKIFNSIIENKPTPILLEQTKCSFVFDFILDICKSFNCNNSKTFCNNCSECKKISSGNYFDLYIIDFYEKSAKKEEIVQLMNNLKYSSLEKAGNKFLVIKGIEKANKQITNLMLTTIESKQKNTYYIFTSKNVHSVLETILSRCYIFRLETDYQKAFDILKLNNVEVKYIPFLVEAFYEVDEMLEFYISKDFKKCVEFCDVLLDSRYKIVEFKKLLNTFKTFDYKFIEKIFYYLLKTTEKKLAIYELIKNIHLNINKTLIFNELINALFY